MKKDFMPFLSLMVVIFSSFIILFTPLRPKVSFVQPDLKLIPTAIPTSAEWQVYKSPKYDFEFKYPKGLELSGQDLGENFHITTTNHNWINFTIIPDASKTIAEYLVKQDKISQTAWEGQPSMRVISTKKTVINDLNSIQRQEYLLAADMQVITTYFKNSGRIIKFQFQSLPENPTESDISLYDRILETVKFN